MSKSCLYLRCIRNNIDRSIATPASTKATSLVHSKLHCCYSPQLNIRFFTRTNRLQLVLNSANRAVTQYFKVHQITPILICKNFKYSYSDYEYSNTWSVYKYWVIDASTTWLHVISPSLFHKKLTTNLSYSSFSP